MPQQRVLSVGASGPVTQAVLDQLRADLGLHRQGRLSDEMDDYLGYRRETESVGGGESQIHVSLWRSTGGWVFAVAYQGQRPSEGLLDAWRDRFRAASARAGLTVSHERTKGNDWRALGTDQIRALARKLAAADKLLHSADHRQVVAELGWRVCEEARAKTVLADTGLGVGECAAELWLYDDGTVRGLSAPLCDRTVPPSGEAVAFRLDAFATATRALTEEFGPPTVTRPGVEPLAEWRLAAVTLTLRQGQAGVDLSVTLKERATRER